MTYAGIYRYDGRLIKHYSSYAVACYWARKLRAKGHAVYATGCAVL